MHLGFTEAHTNVSAARGGSLSAATNKSLPLWLTTRDLQTALLAVRIRFNETHIAALGQLVEAFAVDHKAKAKSVSTGTRASLALATVQPDVAFVSRRRTHTIASNLAPAPMLSKQAYVPGRINRHDKGLKMTPCRINAQWLRMYLSRLRLTQRSSLVGGHPAGGVSSSASFPTKSISRSLSSGAVTTRRSMSGTGINTITKASGGDSVNEASVGGDNTSGVSTNGIDNSHNNDDNNEKSHGGTHDVLLSPASSSSSSKVNREGKKGRGSEEEKMGVGGGGDEVVSGGGGGGGGGSMCRALRKALSGKPHHLSKDEMNRLLEGQIIIPKDVLEEEIAHRVRYEC